MKKERKKERGEERTRGFPAHVDRREGGRRGKIGLLLRRYSIPTAVKSDLRLPSAGCAISWAIRAFVW